MKLLEYILKRGGMVKVEAIPAPSSDPTSLQKVFCKKIHDTMGDFYLYEKLSTKLLTMNTSRLSADIQSATHEKN